MSNEITSNNQQAVAIEPLPEPVQRSKQAWRRFGLWLRSIPPAGLVRFGLTIGALVTIGWLIRVAWLALLPFVVGLVIAYILLPVVNRSRPKELCRTPSKIMRNVSLDSGDLV